MTNRHPHFIPDSHAGSRKDTAVLLVGTAREFGIDQHSIKAVQGSGFRITQELADVLYHESDDSNASGNRAAKNSTNEQESA